MYLTPFSAAAVVVFAASLAPAHAGASSDRQPVRVVLQITVDQLRGDFVARVRDRLGADGMRRIYDQGAVFSDAHHAHAITETIVGHATLATGADPSVHGMIGNVWFDRASSSLHYNIEDARFEIAGDESLPGAGAGHAALGNSRGRSPERMLAPTIADAIAASGDGKAKVFAVSLKDRGAVPMSGRAGKAFWWSERTGRFVSSTYYYAGRELPAWAQKWNDERQGDRLDGRTWDLLLEPGTYLAHARDDMPWEIPPAGMDRTFPHRFDRMTLGQGFFPAVTVSPFADELVGSFTRELVAAEEIGRDEVTDYLSVSFSAPDYIGHTFGPSSLELEDALLRVDRVIASLLKTIDDAAGPGRSLIVLSSDHGVVESPAELIAAGRDGGRVVLSQLEATDRFASLVKALGGKPVRNQWPPYVYLDEDALRSSKVDPGRAAEELAAELARAPGVEATFTRAQIVNGSLPDTVAARAVRRSFHPERSGDIHIVTKPGWQLAYEGPGAKPFSTGHGTPWRYDSFVPLVFAGAGVPRGVTGRRVETIDAAPTIAAILGIAPPARAHGKVLSEALP